MGLFKSKLNFDYFPDDIVLEIALHLDLKSIEMLRLTSKKYVKLLNDNFWKMKCQIEFWIDKKEEVKSWKYTYLYNYLPKIKYVGKNRERILNRWFIRDGNIYYNSCYRCPIAYYDPLHNVVIYMIDESEKDVLGFTISKKHKSRIAKLGPKGKQQIFAPRNWNVYDMLHYFPKKVGIIKVSNEN